MRTVVATVGASLLTNRGDQPERHWQGWTRGTPLPEQDTALAYLRVAAPEAASAETHTLDALLLEETDHLAWLHSDTPDGVWCAQMLHDHYAARGYRGDLHRLDGLGYDPVTFGREGLRSLLTTTFDLVTAAGQGDSVVLCATGGFKASMAYLNLVGLLLGVPVCYLHESFPELLWLPRLPIDWNLAWVEEHKPFFDWIVADLRSNAEVEPRLRSAPDLRALVVDEEGYTRLSTAGELLYGAFKTRQAMGPAATWPPASTRAPRQKDGVSGQSHHRPSGWERWVQKLTMIDCVEHIRFDDAGKGYRGGPGPRIYASDPVRGSLGIVWGQGAQSLPLLVETTARGEAQLNLVRRHIEEEMGALLKAR